MKSSTFELYLRAILPAFWLHSYNVRSAL